MTWARDNICRLWSETVLPDDGLVDVQQFDLKALQDPKLHATRHKNRFVHKLGHIRLVIPNIYLVYYFEFINKIIIQEYLPDMPCIREESIRRRVALKDSE